MHAIILAAGRGTRMAPLTDNLPKPMLSVLSKNLIEWKLEALPPEVTHIILIVGYKKEVIMEHFGTSWHNIPITYIEQTTLNGTGGAVALCREHVVGKAVIMMGDDIYKKSDIAKLCAHDFAMLVHDGGEAAKHKKGQIIEENNLLAGINEGDTQSGVESTLINTGACIISKEYFNYPPVQFSATEFGLPHTLVSLSKDIPVHIVRASDWIQITAPEDIEKAEAILKVR